MTIYYSPAAKAFFDSAIHGERTIEVPDEEALKAIIEEAAADDSGDADAASQRQARVERAVKTVDNPACLLPEDAIEVSEEEHARLLAGLSHGKVLTVLDGKLEIAERDVPIEEQLDAIRARRDRELAATDWTQVPDALTAAKRKLWADHRKALRDLPALLEQAVKAGKPVDSVEFPKPPA